MLETPVSSGPLRSKVGQHWCQEWCHGLCILTGPTVLLHEHRAQPPEQDKANQNNKQENFQFYEAICLCSILYTVHVKSHDVWSDVYTAILKAGLLGFTILYQGLRCWMCLSSPLLLKNSWEYLPESASDLGMGPNSSMMWARWSTREKGNKNMQSTSPNKEFQHKYA